MAEAQQQREKDEAEMLMAEQRPMASAETPSGDLQKFPEVKYGESVEEKALKKEQV